MDRLHANAHLHLDLLESVAVVLKQDGKHAGILYRHGDDGEFNFLHLTNDYQLQNDQPQKGYASILPQMPALRAEQVAALCKAISIENKQAIPYNFGPHDECFDKETKRFKENLRNTGLTCATFVLAVFHDAAWPLAKAQTWPLPDKDDREFQQRAASYMSRSPTSVIHKQVGVAPRFRPSQVAACAILRKRWPVSYRHAAFWGEMIVAKLRGESVQRRRFEWFWRLWDYSL